MFQTNARYENYHANGLRFPRRIEASRWMEAWLEPEAKLLLLLVRGRASLTRIPNLPETFLRSGERRTPVALAASVTKSECWVWGSANRKGIILRGKLPGFEHRVQNHPARSPMPCSEDRKVSWCVHIHDHVRTPSVRVHRSR